MLKHISFSLAALSFLNAQGQYTFNNPDSLYAFADRHSNTVKISAQQQLLSRWTKIAAMANVLSYKSPVSFSATDNLLLPVNFIPAEAFGGPVGSFREVTLGQQFVSNFNVNPQLDIINPQNWARVKSAVINQEMTELSALQTRKFLHESIAAAYFNCVSLNEQLIITGKNVKNADSLLTIVSEKQTTGIARSQDLNNARANLLSVKDRQSQLQAQLDQQLNTLKILCSLPATASIKVEAQEDKLQQENLKAVSTLDTRLVQLQSRLLKSELNAGRLSTMPVLSLVFYQGWQHNSNLSFSDNSARWIQSRYLGLRISVPFPPDVTRVSNNYSNKINYQVSLLNVAQQQLQNDINNRNLELEAGKTKNTFETATKLMQLKADNYEKYLNQYKEGILSTDLLLSAFSDLLNAQLNQASAKAARNYAIARITINQSFK